MDRNKKSRVAFLGMLLGLAFVLAYVESLIPFFIGIYGVKLGLANLVVIVALYTLGEKEAFIIAVARIILVGFTFGNLFSMIYSLAGGLLSYFVMLLLKKSNRFSMTGVSVMGGVFHNIGQIIIATFIVSNYSVMYYIPVLMIAGFITGTLIGIVAQEVFLRVGHLLRVR